MEFQKQDTVHGPYTLVEGVRFLGLILSADVKGTEHTASVTEKAPQ